MTNDSVEAFVNNREKHDCLLARSGVREWVAGDSDIVCASASEPLAAAAEDQAQVVQQVAPCCGARIVVVVEVEAAAPTVAAVVAAAVVAVPLLYAVLWSM